MHKNHFIAQCERQGVDAFTHIKIGHKSGVLTGELPKWSQKSQDDPRIYIAKYSQGKFKIKTPEKFLSINDGDRWILSREYSSTKLVLETFIRTIQIEYMAG